jgi:hypothetical protein
MARSTRRQQERNSLIVKLFKSGQSQTAIARDFKLASSRVSKIISTTDRIAERRAQLEERYGAHPNIEGLPDDTPVDVLLLCDDDFQGWSVRVTNLPRMTLRMSTLGDLRRTEDSQLLREPRIGKRIVRRLRIFCPFRGHQTPRGKKG